MKIIDPHVHLFDLAKGAYDWLKPQNPPFWSDKARIHQDFGAADLALAANDELVGFVHVEAGFDNERPHREIEWLEKHVKQPFKSIANLSLEDRPAKVKQSLHRLCRFGSVVGVRHLLDEQASALLCKAHVQQNLALVAEHKLIFETQISGIDDEAVAQLIETARRLPQLTIILSHCCFQPAQAQAVTRWQNNIKALSACKNILIKASGWEMVNRGYTEDDVGSVTKDLLHYFGHQRVMLASNFPLCLFSTSYAGLWALYKKLNLDKATWLALSYKNAQRVYRL